MKKHEGFGFDDPGPPLKYGSLAASEFHYTLINTLSLALELRQTMRLTKGLITISCNPFVFSILKLNLLIQQIGIFR
jgi:hypothetical protein